MILQEQPIKIMTSSLSCVWPSYTIFLSYFPAFFALSNGGVLPPAANFERYYHVQLVSLYHIYNYSTLLPPRFCQKKRSYDVIRWMFPRLLWEYFATIRSNTEFGHFDTRRHLSCWHMVYNYQPGEMLPGFCMVIIRSKSVPEGICG